MPEQPSKRTENEDVAHVDSLLGLLGEMSRREPSPAVRRRLSLLASERLNRSPRRLKVWLKPAFAATFFVVAGLAGELAVHFLEPKLAQNGGTVTASSPVVSPEIKAQSSVEPSVRKPRRVHHSRPTPIKTTGPRQMTVRLPYSNSAIETGTGTTLRVSMTQSELLSLGFPINETVQDRRIVAELTLGDDGLPRAISLPLPLVVMKEKK